MQYFSFSINLLGSRTIEFASVKYETQPARHLTSAHLMCSQYVWFVLGSEVLSQLLISISLYS